MKTVLIPPLENAKGGAPSSTTHGNVELDTPVPHRRSAQDHPGEKKTEWKIPIKGSCKTLPLALSETFTRGMRKTRFVVWWSNAAKRLVPGLYCPDIVTALYALAMWSIGTAGGWAVCQKCGDNYPRRRAKQLYCSHRCQVAAAMQRYRKNREGVAKSKPRTAAKGQVRARRK